MQTNTGKRGVSVLLILAMLIVSVAALVPVAASASPVGANASDIQDFMFQTLSDANQDDTQTDLRFLFSIGDLDYDAVGFVFSKNNSAPTAGATNTFSTTTVYSSVTADGNDIPAPTGRHWVAVKLSEIPLVNFESTIYVRPFIKVGENYSYVDAKSITVCEALTFDKTVAGESAIYNSKSPDGHAYQSGNNFKISKTIAEIRGKDTANEKHFFPTNEDTDGNDLWFEYSILWNETLANTANARISAASFSNHEIYGFYTRDDAEANEFGGHFDLNKTFVYGAKAADGSSWASYTDPAWNCVYALDNGQPLYKGSMTSEATAADYPAIGNYGWHRIGFHFHEEAVAGTTAANKDGLKAHYTGYSELYIDGVKVWKVEASFRGYWKTTEEKWSGQSYALIPNRKALFFARGKGCTTANSEFAGNIEYNNVEYVDLDTVTVNMTIDDVANSTNAVYIAVSDVQYTCGDGFVRQVSPASLYPDREITLGNTDCSGKICYVFDNLDN